MLPSRQISRIGELAAFLDAGVDVIKIQGRSLPSEMACAIISRYRAAMEDWRAGREPECRHAQTRRGADPGYAALPRRWTVQGR